MRFYEFAPAALGHALLRQIGKSIASASGIAYAPGTNKDQSEKEKQRQDKEKQDKEIQTDESITQVTLDTGEKKHIRTYGKMSNDEIIRYYQRLGKKVVCIDGDCDLDVEENFADGKVKGKSRPGRVKKAGASCKGSVTSLRAKAKKHGGEKGKMYHWCANMKGGKK